MSEWTQNLFEKIESGGRWADFQGLTSGLRDVIEDSGELWMNAPAIRLTYAKHGRDLARVRGHYQVSSRLPDLC